MTKKHNCDACNYSTHKHSNLVRHMKTDKHKRTVMKLSNEKSSNYSSKNEECSSKNEEYSSKNEECSIDDEELDNKKYNPKEILKCTYCGKNITKGNKSRHFKTCKNKTMSVLTKKNKLATKQTEKYEEKSKFYKQKWKETENRLKNVYDLLTSFIDNPKAIDQEKDHYNSSYVLKNFKDAYNLNDLLAKPLTEEETATAILRLK